MDPNQAPVEKELAQAHKTFGVFALA